MKKSSLTLLAILSQIIPLQASDPTTTVVAPGETVTSTVNLPTAGDELIIEKGGAVAVAGVGVEMDAANQTTLNRGTIATTTDFGYGVDIAGTAAVVNSSGQISTTGDSAYGIRSEANEVKITNSGQIDTIGENAFGINSNLSDDVEITNRGEISTAGQNANGVYITNASDSVVITNSGQITATGVTAYGIRSSSLSTNLRVINSGVIKSTQSRALSLEGTNPTLSLLRGSNIQGTVVVGTNFTLNVEKGLNLALTLTSGSFNNLGMSLPFVQVGSTIATIDPTGLAMQADIVADLSDTILDGIYRHRFDCCNPCGCGLWTQALGSYRKRSEGHDIVGFDNWQGGFLIGYDTYFCEGNLSLFGGATFAKAEVEATTQRADINNYIGGVSYEGCFCNSFLGLAVVAGYVDWDNERFIMNNQVSGGVDKAHADIDGFFISPEATLSHQFDCLRCHPVMSLSLRYAGLFLGDYNEKGSLTNFSVNNREIDLLTTRFETAIPYSCSYGCCCWSVEPYAGVFGRYQVGGNRVDGELLGQSLNFDQGGPRNLAAFLIGFRGIQSYDCLNLFLNLEASFDTQCSSRILGEAGLTWNF